MLDPAEAAAVAEEFGVSDEQVRRDHLLSHLLAVLAQQLPDAVMFFGGPATARTHLPHGRLSEDLDLLAVPQRAEIVADIEAARHRHPPRVWPADMGPSALRGERHDPRRCYAPTTV